VRRDLENELKYKQGRDTRAKITRALLNQVNFELPETAVSQETRNVGFMTSSAKASVRLRDVIEKERSGYSVAANSARGA
jgi:FKBP-type peptidyl-prolyl cis-trans isomerase (trigger factor)